MKTILHTATIDHPTGYIDLIATTAPDLDRQISPYCREHWAKHFAEDEPIPESDDELIKQYFDKSCDAGFGDGEFCRRIEHELEIPCQSNAAPALRDASQNLLEILRGLPKGPQHEAMVILSDLLDTLPTTLPTFTFWCQESNGEGTIYINSLQAADLEAAMIAAVQECCDEWNLEGEEPNYTPEDIHLLGIAAGDVKILHWEDLCDA